jgi:hypothetical protein
MGVMRVTPTARRAPGWWRALQRAWLEWRIEEAEADIAFFKSSEPVPRVLIEGHRRQIAAWRVTHALLTD